MILIKLSMKDQYRVTCGQYKSDLGYVFVLVALDVSHVRCHFAVAISCTHRDHQQSHSILTRLELFELGTDVLALNIS